MAEVPAADIIALDNNKIGPVEVTPLIGTFRQCPRKKFTEGLSFPFYGQIAGKF
jgi:hypothetical protein